MAKDKAKAKTATHAAATAGLAFPSLSFRLLLFDF
jgi:hypothetical protein